MAAALPARLLPQEMRPGFFDHFFDEGDPFGFDRNPEEQLKFARTLEVCGDGPLGRVLELGCAVGSFTEVLAPRSGEVVALDVSQSAVDQVIERTRGHSNVRAVAMSIPDDYPEGTFDLVVASDVLYYLPVEVLTAVRRADRGSVADGGAFVAVHYVPRMGSVLNGDEAHDIVDGPHDPPACSCASIGRPDLARRSSRPIARRGAAPGTGVDPLREKGPARSALQPPP